MSDNNQEQEIKEDELTLLKQRANQMGITYHPNIGVEKLKEKVNIALGNKDEESKEGDGNQNSNNVNTNLKSEKPKLSKNDKKRMLHSRLRKEANKLMRVRVTCMNPNKKNWTGEILSVSNAVIGTIKKFIPFNIEEGYHIPTVLYNMMKERQYQHFQSVKLPNGHKRIVTKLLPEFSIEIMDALTLKELEDLKYKQAANHNID